MKIFKLFFSITLSLPILVSPVALISCSKNVNKKSFINLNDYADISKNNSLTGRIQSNKNYSFDEIKEIGKNFVNSLNYDFKKELVIQVVNNYFKTYINSKGSTIQKTIPKIETNGNVLTISYDLIYTKEFNTSLIFEKRSKGDIEEYIVTFDLNNLTIYPYINTSLTNYLSFKFKPNTFVKKFKKSNSKNYEYQIQDNTIEFNTDNQQVTYLNKEYYLSLDFNNSLNSINLNEKIKNSYLYNKSNEIEKSFYLETIKLLENRENNLYFAVDQVDSYYPKLTTSGLKLQGIIEQKTNIDIKLINQKFLNNLSQELITLYNFPATINCANNGKYNFIYIEPSNSTPIKTILPENNDGKIIDLETNQNYKNNYYSFLFSNDSYKNLINVKNKINNVLSKNVEWINNEFNTSFTFNSIDSNFKEFNDKLSVEQKAYLIYKLLLPEVSYGQLNQNSSNIIGFIENKVLCQGYAMTFSYIANIFNIQNVYITGYVYTNAVPGQSDSSGLHAWNAIYDNEKWTWFDPTWDDSLFASSSYKYDYFMLPKNKFFSDKSHINITNWDNGNFLDFYK
ncbi:transglutaminase domain-containing protein [Malacoplasma iowae]|uniref:Transglutaminase-like superfamily domain-containing protein n=1 Tax=Malacoplasma iowae DK-CPA TaxID=1394179 RepID=A0A084U4J8_MALIO|nr:transglutaminase domain-containing protein [Malacoplasma iowae]KFB07884.1 transglutaminase-like superfamily domain-containing protein [Malacoplasma iowae DK-CPA]WPL37969.1 hypothetical protein QX182_00370 [Malacoplasma iowae]WPL40525.1 hypothetical protein QX184_03200 [Malacoplasma iowae]